MNKTILCVPCVFLSNSLRLRSKSTDVKFLYVQQQKNHYRSPNLYWLTIRLSLDITFRETQYLIIAKQFTTE